MCGHLVILRAPPSRTLSLRVTCSEITNPTVPRAAQMTQNSTIYIQIYTLADPGGAAGTRPQGSRFFRFDIQIFQNVATSGVGAPL